MEEQGDKQRYSYRRPSYKVAAPRFCMLGSVLGLSVTSWYRCSRAHSCNASRTTSVPCIRESLFPVQNSAGVHTYVSRRSLVRACIWCQCTSAVCVEVGHNNKVDCALTHLASCPAYQVSTYRMQDTLRTHITTRLRAA